MGRKESSSVKPTPAQRERMKQWLTDRVDAIVRGKFSPVLGSTLDADIRAGVDFSEVYVEYGFAPDGNRPLPNFREVNRHRATKI